MSCALIPAITGIWIGFLLSISFMESWLKFRAPGVTLQTGLSIGNLVFTALNRIEWILLLIIAVLCFTCETTAYMIRGLLIVLAIIQAIQTLWLLPLLSARAKKRIAGETIQSSPAHFYFIVAEIIKLVLLVFCMFSTLPQS